MTARRRVLLSAIASYVLVSSVAASAQSKRPVVIGWLSTEKAGAQSRDVAVLKESLLKLGWKEGADYLFEARWADGRVERLTALAESLAARNPTVVLAYTSLAARAAHKAMPNTPIVLTSGDPVASGLVTNLSRPGGMITGMSNMVTQVTEKHLELLLAAAPGLRRVGFLADANSPTRAGLMAAAHRAIKQHPIEAVFADAANPEQIEAASARLAHAKVQGLVLMTSNFFSGERHRIANLAIAQRWPAIGGATVYADAGVLLGYGPHLPERARRAAYYVDRILSGAKPGDLPIEQPTKFELVVNLKTAKALGLTIPQEVLLRADKVIE